MYFYMQGWRRVERVYEERIWLGFGGWGGWEGGKDGGKDGGKERIVGEFSS